MVYSAGVAREAHGPLWECGFHKDNGLNSQVESFHHSVPRLILPFQSRAQLARIRSPI